jgi:hypothetical protein
MDAGGQFIAALIAIAGFVAFCALIAWFVGSFVDYAAQLFDDEDGKVAHGDVPHLPEGLRPAHLTAELNERADTNFTHSLLLSTPPSCGR